MPPSSTRPYQSEVPRRTPHALTPAGHRLIDTIAPALNPIFDQLRARVPVEDGRTLYRLLDVVVAAAQTGADG